MSIHPFRDTHVPPHQRLIPRLEESFEDCGYLFRKFREQMETTGTAGIAAVYWGNETRLPDATAKNMALFMRMIAKGLSGKIEGAYKAAPGEFFLLLVPAGLYNEEIFQQDMSHIRLELCRHLSLAPPARGKATRGTSNPAADIIINGVFLTGRAGEKSDNTLFKAFQELFRASSSPHLAKSSEQLEIEEIIRDEQIVPVYQPIISLRTGKVLGFEALSRIARPSIFMSPDELFRTAGQLDLTAPLEKLCRRKALIEASEQGISSRIFINVCPNLLQASDHEKGTTATLLDELGLERSMVTFELTERTMIEDFGLFKKVLAYYRSQGYSIAIDDLGSGYSGLKMLAQLEPEYVKLSRFLISDIDTSSTKQSLAEALVAFCDRIGAKVIAEGIERHEELKYLVSAGVSFGQGFLLGKPSPSPLSQNISSNLIPTETGP